MSFPVVHRWLFTVIEISITWINFAHNNEAFHTLSSLGVCNNWANLNSTIWISNLLKKYSNNSSGKEIINNNLLLVTYATSNIMDYASYALAVNAHYSAVNNYKFVTFTPDTGDEHEPRDQRWNRVKILLDMFEGRKNFLGQLHYAVWIDADLIFLNMKFKLEDVISEYPWADIIISAERHAETGVANTGCFIIRNSTWSIRFLNLWWKSFDRSLNHDQIFFDKLYKQLLPDVRNHVAILPTERLNSDPPAMLHQKPSHDILHLMGESTALRRDAFKYALQEICDSLHHERALKSQLGLTQPVLKEMAVRNFESKVDDMFSSSLNSSSLKNDSDIGKAREMILQLHKYEDENCESCNKKRLRRLERLYRMAQDKLSSYFKTPSLPSSPTSSHQLELLQIAAILGNDLLPLYTDNPERQSLLFTEIRANLKLLKARVHHSTVHLVDEMLASLENSHGTQLQRLGDTDSALERFRESVRILRGPTSPVTSKPGQVQGQEPATGRNPFRLVQPLLSLARLLCLTGKFEEGLQTFEEAVGVQESLLYAEEQWKEDHVVLGLSYLHTGLCALQADRPGVAAERLSRAEHVLGRAPGQRDVSKFIAEARRLREEAERREARGAGGRLTRGEQWEESSGPGSEENGLSRPSSTGADAGDDYRQLSKQATKTMVYRRKKSKGRERTEL